MAEKELNSNFEINYNLRYTIYQIPGNKRYLIFT
jgi:hypothetical protein